MIKYTGDLEFLQKDMDHKARWRENEEKHGSIRTNMGRLALTSELYAYVGDDEVITAIDLNGKEYKLNITVKER